MLLFPDFKMRFGQYVDAAGEWQFDTTIQSLVVSMMSIGTLIGALAGAYTADWFGRRRSLSVGVAVFIIGNIIQITAMYSWVHLMVGRIVAGLGVGVLSIGVPMFQSECCPREIRGAVVASYQLMITIGILISNIINYGVRDNPGDDTDASWRIVIGLGIAFSVPLGVGVLFSPESPRWLAGRGQWEEARMSLARLRGKKDDPNDEFVNDDFKEMQESIAEQAKAGQGTWVECFTGQPSGIPRLVYRTFLGCGLQFFQQWTGISKFNPTTALAAQNNETNVGSRLLFLLRRDRLRVCGYRRSHPDTVDPRCRQRRHDCSWSLDDRTLRSPHASCRWWSLAGSLVAHLRHYWYCPPTDRVQQLRHRYDCLRVHVHCVFRFHLGTLHLGRHWRDFSFAHSSKTGLARYRIQLAGQLLDQFPDSLRQRRYRLRLWFRLLRMQLLCCSHGILLRFRDQVFDP